MVTTSTIGKSHRATIFRREMNKPIRRKKMIIAALIFLGLLGSTGLANSGGSKKREEEIG